MGWGVYSVFNATMSSGGTLTAKADLSRGWKQVFLEIPAMNSNTALYVQASTETNGTFRRVYHPQINSATVAVNPYIIPSSVTNAIVPLPTGLRFVKIEATATVDNGVTFKLICAD